MLLKIISVLVFYITGDVNHVIITTDPPPRYQTSPDLRPPLHPFGDVMNG